MEKQGRKILIGANWKCNGSISFTKDIITNMMNTLEYEPDKIGG
jgi:triosephosphate isomerase